MARLPNPGGDSGEWGDILNSFLGVAHNDDGTLKSLDPDDVGLGNVDNTSDVTKNSAVATLTNKTIDANGTGNSITNLETADFATNVIDTDDTLTANSDTRIATQQATKAYVDNSTIAALPEPGGTMMQDPQLSAWFSDLENPRDNPIDLVYLGDSIHEIASIALVVQTQLATRFNSDLGVPTVTQIGYRRASSGGWGPMDTIGGTSSTDVSGFGGYHCTMTNGQSCAHTATCDGVLVVWRENTGTLTIKDGGSGGTTIGTIDTTTGNGWSNVSSFDFGTLASREIWIGSTGNTTLEGIFVTVGNLDAGIRVWDGTNAGTAVEHFANDSSWGIDLIAGIKALTGREVHYFLAPSFNTAEVDYQSEMEQLIDSIQAVSSGSGIIWSPWLNPAAGKELGRGNIARAIGADKGLAVIDAGRAFGDISAIGDANNLSGDGAHPSTNGAAVLALHELMVLTGDPLGTLAAAIPMGYYDYTGTFTGPTTGAHTGNWKVDGGDNGSLEGMSVFGYPYIGVKVDDDDLVQQVLIAPSSTMSVLTAGAITNAVIALGVGGGTAQDVFLMRTAAGELSIRASATTYANVVTNLIRNGAGSPEASVTAPVGANYTDTTNGTNYIKTVGTGNTGWAYASGVQPINAQVASYPLVLADQFKMVTMTSGSAMDLTVPLNSSVAYPVGTRIDITQLGAGQVTVVATGGVTINATPGLKLSGQYAAASLVKTATNTWLLIGSLSA